MSRMNNNNVNYVNKNIKKRIKNTEKENRNLGFRRYVPYTEAYEKSSNLATKKRVLQKQLEGRKNLKAKRARGNQAPIHPRNNKSYKAVKPPPRFYLNSRRPKGKLEVPNAKASRKIINAFKKEIAVGAPTTRTKNTAEAFLSG